MSKAIAITGIGIMSPIGIGKDAFWESLFQGRTGFRPITLFDTAPFQTRLAGEIADFDPVPIIGKKGLRDLDRSTRLLCCAAKLAMDDSRLAITEENTDSIGVSIGSTFGSLHSISQFDRTGLIEGPRSVNPSHFPNTVLNSPASQVSIRFRIKGFNTTVSTGFCAGVDAVSYAADFIRLKKADIVFAGGVEELCEETFMAFHNLGYLSKTDASEARCCPFDARRNGFVLSEGAGVLILESEENAAARGIPVLARVRGYANAFDPAADISFLHPGQGLKRAIEQALNDASFRLSDIDYVCASANSSKGLDRMETSVIRDIFGDHADTMPVSSIKSMAGETYSASGALALAAAVGALRNGLVPPTAGYREPDPECDLDYVPAAARRKQLRNVLVLAADPYGQNSAMILGR